MPAIDCSRPSGCRLSALNRSEGFSGTLVPLKSFKSIQHPKFGKELVAYLQVEALGIQGDIAKKLLGSAISVFNGLS